MRYNMLNDFFDDNLFNIATSVKPKLSSRADILCNIYKQSGNFIFDLYLPGFSRDDFDIGIDNNILTVKGVSDYKKKNYIHQEHYQSTKFERSFSLPKNVDIDNVDADYTSGVLSISIPTFEERKPTTKKITIK